MVKPPYWQRFVKWHNTTEYQLFWALFKFEFSNVWGKECKVEQTSSAQQNYLRKKQGSIVDYRWFWMPSSPVILQKNLWLETWNVMQRLKIWEIRYLPDLDMISQLSTWEHWSSDIYLQSVLWGQASPHCTSSESVVLHTCGPAVVQTHRSNAENDVGSFIPLQQS